MSVQFKSFGWLSFLSFIEIGLALSVASCKSSTQETPNQSLPISKGAACMSDSIDFPCTLPSSDAELRKLLSPEQYEVIRKNGTERPFQNAFWDNHEEGIYVDAVSGEPLFSSTDKFESGTGWPSFTQAIRKESVVEKKDLSHGMLRIEARSKVADSHLGHIFNDGPAPTGLRFCINSASLIFIPKSEMKVKGYSKWLNLFN